MINVETYSANLDAHIIYLEKIYSHDEQDKKEVQWIQRDLGYKLDKILEHYDTMNSDNIKHLLSKIAKINTLMGTVE